MSFAFLGRFAGRLCLYSQLTGVLPSYQSRGLGYQIKLLQREIAGEGIERIAWAFDPLQAGNAHFNLARLGASAGKYVENMYGQRTDALNAGVATDRLIVEWNTQDEPVTVSDDAISNLPRLIETVQGGDESTEIRPIELSEDRRWLVAWSRPHFAGDSWGYRCPPARERRDGGAMACSVAQAFQAAFAAGYHAVHFIREETQGKRRGFYVLERL